MITVLTAIAAVLALAFAVVATDQRRHWFVSPSAVIVLLAIVAPIAAALAPAGPQWARVSIAVVFAAVGVVGGSPVVGLVLRFAQGSVILGEHGGIVVSSDGGLTQRREILRGGATIGYLERIALLGSVAAGQAAAVAIIVAIKGLGRFSELDGSEARERFIIGTLTSLIWAGACVAAALLAL